MPTVPLYLLFRVVSGLMRFGVFSLLLLVGGHFDGYAWLRVYLVNSRKRLSLVHVNIDDPQLRNDSALPRMPKPLLCEGAFGLMAYATVFRSTKVILLRQ